MYNVLKSNIPSSSSISCVVLIAAGHLAIACRRSSALAASRPFNAVVLETSTYVGTSRKEAAGKFSCTPEVLSAVASESRCVVPRRRKNVSNASPFRTLLGRSLCGGKRSASARVFRHIFRIHLARAIHESIDNLGLVHANENFNAEIGGRVTSHLNKLLVETGGNVLILVHFLGLFLALLDE